MGTFPEIPYCFYYIINVMNYELNIEYYRGPLDKLLELIEKKKLKISELSLAEVTADFLDYIQKIQEKENQKLPAAIADFLIVASKLILIKSKSLMPALELEPEEEEEIRDLENRLKIYREFKIFQLYIKKGWNEMPKLLSREYLMSSGPIFYPPKDLTSDMLKKSVEKIFVELRKINVPKANIKKTFQDLKSKIEEVLFKVTGEPKDFNDFVENKNKSELIVLFLAFLHLIKMGQLTAQQNCLFGKIIVKRQIKD